MGVQDDAERLEPDAVEAWSAWLATHHDSSRGVWLVLSRRSTGRRTVAYEDAVVEALRYGWIDATRRSLDQERSMLWFSPRRPVSGWSASNKVRVAALRAEGRMEPAGEEAVRVARHNGTWHLFDDVEALVVPDDLAAELAARPGARERWDALPPSARRVALAQLVQAKRTETRARRVSAIGERVARGERP